MAPRNVLFVTFVASVSLPTVPAMAQNEEIIVTARKREESILKVPVIATAITQDQLIKNSVGDIDAIADRVTGLQVGSGVGQNGTQISLRGV